MLDVLTFLLYLLSKPVSPNRYWFGSNCKEVHFLEIYSR